MYFPEDMTFQYFFFDTYPGYFLQVLPFALAAGGLYVFCHTRRDRRIPIGQAVSSALFICYLVALLCLTLLHTLIGSMYYELFYHMDSGNRIPWFTFEFYLIPDSWHNLSSESIGNILLFLPFGILYPLFRKDSGWIRTLLFGIGISLAIELHQPVFGRSFDINDIILNEIGVLVSTALYYGCRLLVTGRG